MLNRRDVLKIAALAPVGAALGSSIIRNVASAEKLPEIKRYKMLGKTGQKISDLSLGGGGLEGPRVVQTALQMGITYIDTAPDYGQSEKNIGLGWKRSGVGRDKFHITTKICRPGGYPGHAKYPTTEKEVIRLVEGSLKRLQTDYIDNLFVHALGERGPKDIQRLKDENVLAAAQTLKKQGKIRFLGCSSHGPHKAVECLRYAVESGHYDVIMPAYNYYAWKGLKEVLETAKEKGVGVIAMKTLRGGKQARRKGVLPKGNFAHASFKWVWSNDAVAGLVVTMGTMRKLKNYAKASGQTLAEADAHDLSVMHAATNSDVCRIGCGDCLERCSQGVEMPTVFRADMYYTDYADTMKASSVYEQLAKRGADASKCGSCTNQTCVNACTYGVDIRSGMLEAHARLGKRLIG